MGPKVNEQQVQDVPVHEEHETNMVNIRLKSSGLQKLQDKKFESRTSILIELFDSNPHIKTIYLAFVAYLVYLMVNSSIRDYITKKGIRSGFRLIALNFEKFDLLLCAWMIFIMLTCLCYFGFVVWATVKLKFPPKSKIISIWNVIWASALVGYYVFSFWLSTYIVIRFEFGRACVLTLLMDQTRLLMKIHSFVRNTAPKVLKYKPHSDVNLDIPGFSKVFFFLFAPTLIYRDEYPRTKAVRWNFIVFRVLELLGVILLFCFIFEKLITNYQDFGARKFTLEFIILSILENTILSMIALAASFFVILHSVQNAFAELLRFADRQFYKDWWACSCYSEYFKTWNIVVHDWLYAYVYKDMYETITPGRNNVAKFTVFIISIIVHEWFITVMTGYFFPITAVLFFLGSLLSNLRLSRKSFLNAIFLYCLACGSSIIISLEMLEYYARTNGPLTNENSSDYISLEILKYIA